MLYKTAIVNLVTIKGNGESFFMTPDTSINRDGKDYFCPEFADEFAAACFLYVRIAKNAKSVGEKYAARYISGFGYGVRLEACNIPDNGAQYRDFISVAFDNTAYISPLFTQEEFVSIRPTLKIGNTNMGAIDQSDIAKVIDDYQKVIANITRISTLRSGDMLLFETDVYNREKPCLSRCISNMGTKGNAIIEITFGDIDIRFNR